MNAPDGPLGPLEPSEFTKINLIFRTDHPVIDGLSYSAVEAGLTNNTDISLDWDSDGILISREEGIVTVWLIISDHQEEAARILNNTTFEKHDWGYATEIAGVLVTDNELRELIRSAAHIACGVAYAIDKASAA